MQVLKFGGSSVASAAAIGRVVEIVSKAIEHDRTIVVCSAIGGCTDTLIEIGRRAASGDESFQTLLDQLKERHHTIISELLPGVFQEKVTETVPELWGIVLDKDRYCQVHLFGNKLQMAGRKGNSKDLFRTG